MSTIINEELLGNIKGQNGSGIIGAEINDNGELELLATTGNNQEYIITDDGYLALITQKEGVDFTKKLGKVKGNSIYVGNGNNNDTISVDLQNQGLTPIEGDLYFSKQANLIFIYNKTEGTVEDILQWESTDIQFAGNYSTMWSKNDLQFTYDSSYQGLNITVRS